MLFIVLFQILPQSTNGLQRVIMKNEEEAAFQKCKTQLALKLQVKVRIFKSGQPRSVIVLQSERRR